MRIGDYVRFHGYIDKIININEFREPSMKYALEKRSWNDDIIFIGDEDIDKSSPNIIDLISYGDIVKYKIDGVLFISEVWGEENDYFIQNFDVQIDIKDLEIISIVTREQFERMQYKVGE